MRGFVFSGSSPHGLVAPYDMTVVAWAAFNMSTGADGTAVGAGFAVNGVSVGTPSIQTPGHNAPCIINTGVQAFVVSKGDVIQVRIYSDDPSNTLNNQGQVIIAEVTDEDFNSATVRDGQYGGVYILNNNGQAPLYLPNPYYGEVADQAVLAFAPYGNDFSQYPIAWWAIVGDDIPVAGLSDAINSAVAAALQGVPTVIGPIEVNFDTADLAAGIVIYNGSVGEKILDMWVEIDTPWDGTTPKGDIAFTNGGGGIWAYAGHLLDMTLADSQYSGDGVNYGISQPSGLAALSGLMGKRFVPLEFTADGQAVRFIVSQTGGGGGADPGATQGSAKIFIHRVQPVAPLD